MKKNILAYQLFNWGPILCRIKLNAADLKKYAELCSKKTEHINENLAGVIKHEHAVDLQKYGTIINPYIKIFYEAFQQWYNIPPPGKLVIMRAWANFMVAGEFNPPHMHPNCDFSSVLFVKIPEEGDFYIFPASLIHFVSPFTSGGERISISANFTFDFKRK